jgi:2-C-methyl-D-erythritol 2,4-cyclodiphosphate synthase
MFRIGNGYDVHKFGDVGTLVLGGVEIDYPRRLEGHSDADVLVHAVMDALLGALALGDIGVHFPDTCEQFKNADSCKLLEKVVEMLTERGWKVGNIDSTIVAEEPKLARYIVEMRENIARICGISADCVSVKATTEEGMGLAGRGIAAHSVCILFKSAESSEMVK